MRFFTRRRVMNDRFRVIGYRFWSWFRHQLTSWNTGGEGIHSPYLFYIVRMLGNDGHQYYCWSDIEDRREAMLRAPKLVNVQDFGSGGDGKIYQRLVSDIAHTSLLPARYAQFFFRIIAYLSHEAGKPLNIVELGTNLGLTSAYLQLAERKNKVTTFEGAGELIQMAQLNWQKLGIHTISVVEGNIDDTLSTNLPKQLDFGYMDANHRLEPTLRYFDLLAQRAHGKTIIAIDDIHYSPEMEQAWHTIQQRSDVTTTMDFYHLGLVFFDTHYLKRHYKLRL